MSEVVKYPPDWQPTTLSALAEYINGYPFKPSDWSTIGLPIVRIAQMTDATAAFDRCPDPLPPEYQIDTGDLLFSWSATLASLIWQRGPAYLNQHIFKVVPKNGHCLGFLHHLLNRLIEPMANQSHGTTMKHITRADLLPFPATVPMPEEQSRIALVLDTVDEAIAKTEAVIAKLRQVRAGLLHDLLTRGLDEHGQLRDPIAHPEQFQPSPLGQIPKEWEVIPVEHAGEVRLGRQRSPAHETGQHIRPYLRVANVFDGFIDYSDVLSMNFELSEQETYELRPGDILLNEGQSLELVGRSAIFPGPAGVYCFQNTLVRFRSNGAVIPEFCQAVFKYWLDTRRFTHVAKQTTSVAHLGADRFAKMPFARPKIAEQARIAGVLRTQKEQQQVEELNLLKLHNVKSGLMPDLLTGRVRVPAHV